MQRRQPNSRIRTRNDLNVRDGEHYDVARSLGGSFTRSSFVDRYRAKFPTRNPGSILPSDYCFNQENKGNGLYPRFLLAEGRERFSFAGLDGRGDVGDQTFAKAERRGLHHHPRRSWALSTVSPSPRTVDGCSCAPAERWGSSRRPKGKPSPRSSR